MMDGKKRLSLDDVGGQGHGLWRNRFGLKRSGTASSVASSSEISLQSEGEIGCVSRETSRDECALHRFVVWAAVKRNACPKMTPAEKRECPLLRCRQRFPNHELMLQHLYTCDQLASGEYWCYDCGKVERFNDGSCRRCLGHPSKRKKIMFMAKNFFSSLGHKPRNGSLPDLDLDLDDFPRPSYDTILEPTEAELFSTEIHEIDSSEIPLPTIHESTLETDEAPAGATPMFIRNHTDPQASLRPAELESGMCLDVPLDWQPSPCPSTVSPANLIGVDSDFNADRLALQLDTSGLQHLRSRRKRRGKVLAPSSSVRSTASTNSTVSTMSTNSNASSNSYSSNSSVTSYDISPISNWSDAWAKPSGFESTTTSPEDELISPAGINPANTVSTSLKPARKGELDSNDQNKDPFLFELPADLPMLNPMAPSDPLHDTLGFCPPNLGFEPPDPAELSIESNMAMTDNATDLPPDLNQFIPPPVAPFQVSAHSLVNSSWAAFRMHVDDSLSKLRNVNKNPLVTTLRDMSPMQVALTGLEALTEILDGKQAQPPVKLLCFTHLIYSFSLVIHQQDLSNRASEFFVQAMYYGSRFSRQDRQAYLRVADALWKPKDMSDSEMKNLLRNKITAANSQRGVKGKGPASESRAGEDSLVFVARYFLDELEHSAVQESNEPGIQASDLSVQHIKDISLDAQKDSPFVVAVKYMLDVLKQKYSHATKFSAAIDDIRRRVASNCVSTPRRLELELLRAGRNCLAPNEFFDDYIRKVREQVDPLYAQQGPHFTQRTTYYRHGVGLIESIVKGLAQETANTKPTTSASSNTIESLEDLISSVNPDFLNFDFSSISAVNSNEPASTFDLNFPMLPVSEGNASAHTEQLNEVPAPPLNLLSATTTPLQSATPELTAAATPSSSGQTPAAAAAAAAAASKIESDSCCKLCGYRPKGDPRWFGGSMAKHMKLQHATAPPKIYRCPYPGCTSQFQKRPDNLRQHQIEKGHFVDGQEETGRRPAKRKKTTHQS